MNWEKSNYRNMIERQESIPGSMFDIPEYQKSELPQIANLRFMAKKLLSRLTGCSILIYGDYDADGVMSSGILYKGLLFLTALAENITGKKRSTIDLYIPDRFKDGYGFTVEQAEMIHDKVIILVDNGIAQNEAVSMANKNGNEVFILDHHEPGAELPPASIIVNPHAVKGGEYDVYCAAGLAYRLMREMFSDKAFAGYMTDKTQEDALCEFLFMAAIATVADVVPLLWENRVIVKEGVRKIPAHWKTAMWIFLGSEKEAITEMDISFKIAPSINSAGRLGKLNAEMVKDLVVGDEEKVIRISNDMIYYNTIRKETQKKAMKEIIIEETPKKVYVVQNENVHPGVVGICAGQISDKVHKPAFVFGPVANGTITGSARAPKGTVHLKLLLDRVNEEQPGLIVKHGGHESAAGVTIREDGIALFDELINKLAVYDEATSQTAFYDFDLTETDNWVEIYKSLETFGPFGEGNPAPVLCYRLAPKVTDISVIGKGESIKIRNGLNELVGFGMAKAFPKGKKIRAYGTLDVNEYGGGRKVQMNMKDVVVDESQSCNIFNGKLAI